MQQATPEVRRVLLADKLHNTRSLLADLRRDQGNVWDNFTGGMEGTLWYYRSALEALDNGQGGYLVEELRLVITEIEKQTG